MFLFLNQRFEQILQTVQLYFIKGSQLQTEFAFWETFLMKPV